MPAIIPIPAFADNYIWLIREGASPRSSIPAMRRRCSPTSMRERARADGDPRRRIITRDHVGGNRALLARFRARCSVRRTRRSRAARRRLAKAIASTSRASAVRSTCSTFPAIPRATSRMSATSAARPRVFCGDTLFARLRPPVRGHARADVASLSKLAALPAATRVYCGHEYTLANLRFACAVEPGNADAAGSAEAREQDKRDARRADPAVDDRRGAGHQSVPARGDAGGARRGGSACRTRAAPTTSRRSPRCGRGRTRSLNAGWRGTVVGT